MDVVVVYVRNGKEKGNEDTSPEPSVYKNSSHLVPHKIWKKKNYRPIVKRTDNKKPYILNSTMT